MESDLHRHIQDCIDDARIALKDAGIYADYLESDVDRSMIRDRLGFSLRTLKNIEDVLRNEQKYKGNTDSVFGGNDGGHLGAAEDADEASDQPAACA